MGVPAKTAKDLGLKLWEVGVRWVDVEVIARGGEIGRDGVGAVLGTVRYTLPEFAEDYGPGSVHVIAEEVSRIDPVLVRSSDVAWGVTARFDDPVPAVPGSARSTWTVTFGVSLSAHIGAVSHPAFSRWSVSGGGDWISRASRHFCKRNESLFRGANGERYRFDSGGSWSVVVDS